MTEKWTKWEPIENLERKYYIKQFSYDKNGIEIILDDAIDNSPLVRFVFKIMHCQFRYTDELLRAALLHELNEECKNNFDLNWTFFIIKNSLYLKWLSEQSYDLSERYEFKHYVFFTEDEVLDIASPDEPMVEFLKK